MAPRRRAASKPKKTSAVKKRYLDGKLEFKNKAMLDFHLELKGRKKAGEISSFLVPAINEVVKNKYGAVKVMIDGHVFDSIMESRYYLHLLEEKRAGRIVSFVLQPAYLLLPSFKKMVNGKMKTFRKMEYVADFLVTDDKGIETVIDVKGTVTDVFALKRKLFEYAHQDKTLKCVQLKRKQWIDI